MSQTTLYFIALVAHKPLQAEILALKELFRDRYNAQHALKLPAHITLQKPFRRSPKTDPILIDICDDVAKKTRPFDVVISGFGCFAPKVIFANVLSPEPVLELHARLWPDLKKQLNLKDNEISTHIKPHITLATRDLSRQNFRKAWQAFMHRPFEATFTARSLSVFKHNGMNWGVLHESLFLANSLL